MSAPGGAVERVCAYLLTEAERAAGRGLVEGRYTRPIAHGADAGEATRAVAAVKLRGVDRAVAEGLCAWSRGEREATVLLGVPEATWVLAQQARGARCVTLLPHGNTPPPPHATGLAFALHDLAHLEKFFDPAHHAGQVGLFGLLHDAVASGAWGSLVARHDGAFVADVEGVFADMNGSAVFLLSLLKMRLRVATRRRLARLEGREAAPRGALDAREEAAFAGELERLLDALRLDGEAREAARRVSARRDAPSSGALLDAYLGDAGRARLAARARSTA